MIGSSKVVAAVLAMLVASLARSAEPLKLASLNPIVSALAREIGGDDVEVVDLMPVGADPHTFSPSPSHLKAASRAALVLAAGKGLEPYLGDLRESLGETVQVFEVGNAVPSLKIEPADLFVCCPGHAHHVVDPHWWHSVKNARRAARAISRKLAELDPPRAKDYADRYTDYAEVLDNLLTWAKREIKTIPRADRELATSHTAFGYLCRELGLRSITVQGLTTDDTPAPGYLKDVIMNLRKYEVRAVFPEDNANPKVLAGMVQETGVKVGGNLLAGTLPADEPTYEAMVRHNVTTIVAALRGKER